MFRTITDPTTGEVTEQFIPVPNSFGSGFGEVGVETPEEFFDPDAGVGTEALDTDGNPFIPTGEAGIAFVNGEEVVYEPGRIGRDANGTRMRFTGGNPGDSRNWQTLPGQ